MRLTTTLIPALHALRVHRLRTGLALLGICFGVATVILIVIWGSIGQTKLEAEISELGADVLMVMPGAARSNGAWRANGSSRTLTEADAEAIAREGLGVAAAAPLLRGTVQLVYGNRNQATTLRGVTPAWFEARPWPVTMGRPLADDDVRRSAKVALLGHGIAKVLFGEEDPSGRTIRIDRVPFTVLGVLEEKGHSLGGDDLDDQVMIPLSTARKRILGFFAGHPAAVGGVTLRVMDGADMARTNEVGVTSYTNVTGWSPTARMTSSCGISRRCNAVAFGLAHDADACRGCGGLASCRRYWNHESHAGFREERRQEIGLRMAIGARRREIALQFLIEAGLLAMLGSGVGVLLALAAAAALGAGAAIRNPGTGMAILAAVVTATLVTLISALYPARKAARLDPADALAQS
ncbi:MULTISPECIES: ABC transporter permease [unclassified Bradyrhizobium]|uniref:ABC transporter permease n=1 Tax=unclassified Bradyrhizobium TaxID=2631580 RepID=UPI001FFB99AD|nr:MULTISPECIES: ABC transporter permease [unclassified Bradyrhizobium]MCK1711340.1 ABC transporter permease [Bradyrhizobium sp. 143]MCK1727686.1 ABC transporter permease [Bradyrhizobium sp. 142]